jgi:hypothetical protein
MVDIALSMDLCALGFGELQIIMAVVLALQRWPWPDLPLTRPLCMGYLVVEHE